MLLFVYGTLKRGFSNYHEMEKLEGTFISEAQTVREFPLGNFLTFQFKIIPLVVTTECGIPALLNLPGHAKGNRVKGELWEIPEKRMPVVDEFEAHVGVFLVFDIENRNLARIVHENRRKSTAL